MGSKNSLEKFWLIVWKHVPLQPIIGWPIVPVGAGQANCSLVGWERSIWYEPYGKYVRGELLRDVKAEVKQCE